MSLLTLSRACLRSSAFAAALVLAACGGADEADLNSLDNQIIGNDADPALTSALEDQILVDPTLAQQSNRNAVRPPETPMQAQYPRPQQAAPQAGTPSAPSAMADANRDMTRQGAAPARQPAQAGQPGAGCGADSRFDYNLAWAQRLPEAFPVPPGARITDAAGNNSGDCRVRVVTFTTGARPQNVLAWYHNRARAAGYSSERQQRDGDRILGGVNERTDGAFYLIVTPRTGGGADVALIVNNGR